MRDIGKLTTALAIGLRIILPADANAYDIKTCQAHAAKLMADAGGDITGKPALVIEHLLPEVPKEYIRCVQREVNASGEYSSSVYVWNDAIDPQKSHDVITAIKVK